MLDLNKKWIKIDKENEEIYVDNVRFIRRINEKSLNIDCEICKTLISSIEDVEAMKEANICQNCFSMYYVNNKVKWKKGWRPINNNL